MTISRRSRVAPIAADLTIGRRQRVDQVHQAVTAPCRRAARTVSSSRRSHPCQGCRSRLVVVVSVAGNPYATYSPEYAPPLTATTMYCLPST